MSFLQYNAEWISAIIIALSSIITLIYIRKQTSISVVQKDIELFKLRIEHKNIFSSSYNIVYKYIGFDNGRCIKANDCAKAMLDFKTTESILNSKYSETSFLFNDDKNILKEERLFIETIKMMYPVQCAIYRPDEKIFTDYENSYKNLEKLYSKYI